MTKQVVEEDKAWSSQRLESQGVLKVNAEKKQRTGAMSMYPTALLPNQNRSRNHPKDVDKVFGTLLGLRKLPNSRNIRLPVDIARGTSGRAVFFRCAAEQLP